VGERENNPENITPFIRDPKEIKSDGSFYRPFYSPVRIINRKYLSNTEAKMKTKTVPIIIGVAFIVFSLFSEIAKVFF